MSWISWEWSFVAKLQSLLLRIIYVLICIALCYLAMHVSAWIFLLLSIVFWPLALLAVVSYTRSGEVAWLNNLAIRLIIGAILTTALWESMQVLFTLGPSWLLYGLCIVWVADSAAYVGGRLFGRHLLAERVSPKKTWQGVWAGLIGCCILSVIGIYWLGLSGRSASFFIVISLIAALWSIVGDLFESLLKRRSNIKDSGKLLPRTWRNIGSNRCSIGRLAMVYVWPVVVVLFLIYKFGMGDI